MIDRNWKAILKNAYSMRLMLASGGSAVVCAVQTENPYAILAAILSFIGMIMRVVVQPVLREQFETEKDCINNLSSP